MDTVITPLNKRHIIFKIICLTLTIALLWNEVSFASDEMRACQTGRRSALAVPSAFKPPCVIIPTDKGFAVDLEKSDTTLLQSAPPLFLLYLIAAALGVGLDGAKTKKLIYEIIIKPFGPELLSGFDWNALKEEEEDGESVFILPRLGLGEGKKWIFSKKKTKGMKHEWELQYEKDKYVYVREEHNLLPGAQQAIDLGVSRDLVRQTEYKSRVLRSPVGLEIEAYMGPDFSNDIIDYEVHIYDRIEPKETVYYDSRLIYSEDYEGVSLAYDEFSFRPSWSALTQLEILKALQQNGMESNDIISVQVNVGVPEDDLINDTDEAKITSDALKLTMAVVLAYVSEERIMNKKSSKVASIRKDEDEYEAEPIENQAYFRLEYGYGDIINIEKIVKTIQYLHAVICAKHLYSRRQDSDAYIELLEALYESDFNELLEELADLEVPTSFEIDNAQLYDTLINWGKEEGNRYKIELIRQLLEVMVAKVEKIMDSQDDGGSNAQEEEPPATPTLESSHTAGQKPSSPEEDIDFAKQELVERKMEELWKVAIRSTMPKVRGHDEQGVYEKLKAGNKSAHSIFRYEISLLLTRYLGELCDGLSRVWLFGDVGSGMVDDIRPTSDIDFIIEVNSETEKAKVYRYLAIINKCLTRKFNDLIMRGTGVELYELIEVGNTQRVFIREEIKQRKGIAVLVNNLEKPASLIWERVVSSEPSTEDMTHMRGGILVGGIALGIYELLLAGTLLYLFHLRRAIRIHAPLTSKEAWRILKKTVRNDINTYLVSPLKRILAWSRQIGKEDIPQREEDAKWEKAAWRWKQLQYFKRVERSSWNVTRQGGITLFLVYLIAAPVMITAQEWLPLIFYTLTTTIGMGVFVIANRYWSVFDKQFLKLSYDESVELLKNIRFLRRLHLACIVALVSTFPILFIGLAGQWISAGYIGIFILFGLSEAIHYSLFRVVPGKWKPVKGGVMGQSIKRLERKLTLDTRRVAQPLATQGVRKQIQNILSICFATPYALVSYANRLTHDPRRWEDLGEIKDIGSTRMSEVYTGKYRSKKYVLKWAKDGLHNPYFKNEYRILRKLNPDGRNRHFPYAYSTGKRKGRRYTIMDHIEGKTLWQIGREGRLPEDTQESLNIMLQMAEIINEVHEVGATHNDIKSNNIIFEEDGNIKLIDFNLAKMAEEGRAEDIRRFGSMCLLISIKPNSFERYFAAYQGGNRDTMLSIERSISTPAKGLISRCIYEPENVQNFATIIEELKSIIAGQDRATPDDTPTVRSHPTDTSVVKTPEELIDNRIERERWDSLE
ncbi:MAG: protein kinase, partial [Candidatus Omnitrophica bacterium]|nr:protein kinase [Candidatus Omnitrophota bacterium]